MAALRQFVIVEAVGLLALLVIAAAMALYGAVDSALHDNSLLDPTGAAAVGFGYTMVLGAIPVIVYGAPGYFALLRRGRAWWRYVLLLGIVPGVIALPFGFWTGFLAIICGAAVASLTHLACRRLGPNNSFKPMPLRGTA